MQVHFLYRNAGNCVYRQKQIELLKISWQLLKKLHKLNSPLAQFNSQMNIKDWKGKRGDGWKRNRFACFPRCCAKGGLPLTTWAPEHLHTDEQWQSRIRKEWRDRKQGGRRQKGGKHTKAQVLRIKRKNRKQAQISTAFIYRVSPAWATLYCYAHRFYF